MPFRTLLIDDEKPAINRLERMLQGYPDVFDLIGSAQNGAEGWALIEKMKPDLIFLDIEMPLMTGFEMLTRLSYMPWVIFATAYEEYAVRAFEENSLDYLLKPIEPERLQRTVEKLQQKLPSPKQDLSETKILQLIAQLKPRKEITSISVKIGERILLIRLDEIAYFEAEDKYVNLHTEEGKKHLLDYSLTVLEEKLPNHFTRVSRSVIINNHKVREAQKFFNGKYILLLNDKMQSKITSGSSYADKVKGIFEF
ncbi:MAG: LytTR family DNA-binding domain-containing protein [Microscillaceae bacterium]|jgi:two-component system LytT family response regulator|nr:LytTR family DNA-binding domain-containing protein [Microscillaceae bacterium]